MTPDAHAAALLALVAEVGVPDKFSSTSLRRWLCDMSDALRRESLAGNISASLLCQIRAAACDDETWGWLTALMLDSAEPFNDRLMRLARAIASEAGLYEMGQDELDVYAVISGLMDAAHQVHSRLSVT